MALDGLLEKMPFGEIFQTVSLCKQSGMLTLTHEKGVGHLRFSQGRLVSASSDSVGRLGYTLVKKGLITTEELEQALILQKNDLVKIPLGEILNKDGIVSQDVLQVELKKHFVDVVRNLLDWTSGSFHFEFGPKVEQGTVLEEGLDLPSLLVEATRPADSWRLELPTDISDPIPDPASSSRHEEWGRFLSILPELLGPISTGETVLLVLRYASELFNRCVLFQVKKKALIGVGQCGLQFRDEDADQRIRQVQIPLSEPSLFREVIERPESYRGALEEREWHQYFVRQIGGDWPSEIFLVPFYDGFKTVALLYGDNVPHHAPLTDTRGLEAFVKIAGVAYARTLLEQRLTERRSSE